MQYNLRRTNRS